MCIISKLSIIHISFKKPNLPLETEWLCTFLLIFGWSLYPVSIVLFLFAKDFTLLRTKRLFGGVAENTTIFTGVGEGVLASFKNRCYGDESTY